MNTCNLFNFPGRKWTEDIYYRHIIAIAIARSLTGKIAKCFEAVEGSFDTDLFGLGGERVNTEIVRRIICRKLSEACVDKKLSELVHAAI